MNYKYFAMKKYNKRLLVTRQKNQRRADLVLTLDDYNSIQLGKSAIYKLRKQRGEQATMPDRKNA